MLDLDSVKCFVSFIARTQKTLIFFSIFQSKELWNYNFIIEKKTFDSITEN